MKVLNLCTENTNFFIEVLNELELFIDKKVIFDFGLPPPPRPLSAYFLIRITIFPSNLDTSPFQVKVF
jgi:hypothetical protein